MPLRFRCTGGLCGQLIQTPDGSEGRKARCPHCGSLQTVPANGQARAVADSGNHPSQASPAYTASGPAIQLLCPACGIELPRDTVICPDCRLAAKGNLVEESRSAERTEIPDGSLRCLAIDCLASLRYSASNAKTVFLLVLHAVVLLFILSIVSLGTFLIGMPPQIGTTFTQIIMCGYFARYSFDVVQSSLDNLDDAPNIPEFSLRESLRTGVGVLGIAVVYVTPVVTIPLLPMAILALAYARDWRAFDVLWTIRAVRLAPRQYLLVWMALLIWIVLLGVAVSAISLALDFLAQPNSFDIGSSIIRNLAISFVGGLASWVIIVMLLSVPFRCIGMLGRHAPRILLSLPDEDNPRKGMAWVAGACLLLLTSLTVLGRILASRSM